MFAWDDNESIEEVDCECCCGRRKKRTKSLIKYSGKDKKYMLCNCINQPIKIEEFEFVVGSSIKSTKVIINELIKKNIIDKSSTINDNMIILDLKRVLNLKEPRF